MRSNWKYVYSNPFIDRKIIKRKKNSKSSRQLTVNTPVFSRNSTILPIFVGLRVLVHQGKKLIRFLIKGFMIGHKFGEYALAKRCGASIHQVKKKSKAISSRGGKR
jgi:ribosomal protein S19